MSHVLCPAERSLDGSTYTGELQVPTLVALPGFSLQVAQYQGVSESV